jgi:hypothetical protein
MRGRKSYDVRTRGLRYAELEHGLGVMQDAGAAGIGSLRGRLKRLASLGIPGSGTGKGSRRVYTWEEATQLAVALLLEDANQDPVVTAAALKNVWPQLAPRVMAAIEAPADNPVLLIVLELEAIAGPWRTGNPLAGVPWIAITQRIDERAKAQRITMYRKHFKQAISTDPNVLGLIDALATHEANEVTRILNRDQPQRGWFFVRDLTDRLNVFKTALEQKAKSHGRP